MGLTVKRIARLRRPGRYSDGDRSRLYLQISKTGAKSWLFVYMRNGRTHYLGLGSAGTFSLAEARERARRARQLLADGNDPLAAKRAERAAIAAAEAKKLIFAEAATRYFDQHEGKWRNAKHRDQFLSSLKTYAFPTIGTIDVSAVDTALVLKVIEPIWNSKTVTANRVRQRIEAVLDWATVRSHRVGDNPARWRGHLDQVLPAKSAVARPVHHAALPYQQIGEFMAKLRAREGVSVRALEFLILTAARTAEVTGARWDEVDLNATVWTIPGRTKGGRTHRVPLSKTAVELLRNLPSEQNNEFVFIGARSGSLANEGMAQALKRMGYRDITVHGFRSTFRDWAAERTRYPNHVLELALAHSVGTAVERAYQRSDLLAQRARLMEEWARYCASPAPVASGEVVPIARGRVK
jgi:integrase